MSQLFHLPREVLFSDGVVQPGWTVSFFLTGTTTPTPVYETAARDPGAVHTQPVEADAAGVMAEIYLDPSIVYKAEVRDSAGVLKYTVDPANDSVIPDTAPPTEEEELAGVTVVNQWVPSHLHDGIIRVLRYVNNTTPGTTNLDSGMTAAKAVLAQLENASGVIELQPGTGLYTSGISFTPTGVVKLRGHGSAVTTVKYNGTGDAVEWTNSTGLQECSGFTIDCSGADAAANGLHMYSWRSKVADVNCIPPTGSTGTAYLFDNPSGTFDMKVERLQAVGWGRGIAGIGGGNLSTNAVTNFAARDGYITSCGVNFKFSYALDVSIIGMQSEAADDTGPRVGNGIELDNVQKFFWRGGAIENSDAAGIACGSGVTGLDILAGFFNNSGGDVTGSPTGIVNNRIYGDLELLSLSGAGYGFFTGGVFNALRAGANSPEGVVTAYRGDIRMTQNSVIPYVKAFGSGTNTGWLGMGLYPVEVTAAQLADKTHAINANGFKFSGLPARDTTNRRLYIARGSTDVDPWDLCDGSASVTPA